MSGTNARRQFGMKTRIAFWHAEGIVKSADYAFGSNPPYALQKLLEPCFDLTNLRPPGILSDRRTVNPTPRKSTAPMTDDEKT
jgi:hypothetical protein